MYLPKTKTFVFQLLWRQSRQSSWKISIIWRDAVPPNLPKAKPPCPSPIDQLFLENPLCTHRAIGAPAVERPHALRRQPLAGFVPAARPFCRVAQLGFGVLAAAGDEA